MTAVLTEEQRASDEADRDTIVEIARRLVGRISSELDDLAVLDVADKAAAAEVFDRIAIITVGLTDAALVSSEIFRAGARANAA